MLYIFFFETRRAKLGKIQWGGGGGLQMGNQDFTKGRIANFLYNLS